MIQRIIKQAVRILGERGIRDELAGIPQSGISTRISTTEGVGATPAQPSRIRTTQTTPRPVQPDETSGTTDRPDGGELEAQSGTSGRTGGAVRGGETTSRETGADLPLRQPRGVEGSGDSGRGRGTDSGSTTDGPGREEQLSPAEQRKQELRAKLALGRSRIGDKTKEALRQLAEKAESGAQSMAAGESEESTRS